jgi:hypothetical protein
MVLLLNELLLILLVHLTEMLLLLLVLHLRNGG